eukprot:1675052-Lingulodinium_polyedra.AAC.1
MEAFGDGRGVSEHRCRGGSFGAVRALSHPGKMPASWSGPQISRRPSSPAGSQIWKAAMVWVAGRE